MLLAEPVQVDRVVRAEDIQGRAEVALEHEAPRTPEVDLAHGSMNLEHQVSRIHEVSHILEMLG